jgi:hypothetical protein
MTINIATNDRGITVLEYTQADDGVIVRLNGGYDGTYALPIVWDDATKAAVLAWAGLTEATDGNA